MNLKWANQKPGNKKFWHDSNLLIFQIKLTAEISADFNIIKGSIWLQHKVEHRVSLVSEVGYRILLNITETYRGIT